MVNMKKVKLPQGYDFPPHVSERPRDFHLSWFLTKEIGVAAIPPTGTFQTSHDAVQIGIANRGCNDSEFYTKENAHIAEDYLRFAVCKNDDVLETAKTRLRGLKKYIQSE